ncbi:hypothetical protein ACQJ6W_00190 [Helicobacter pylori]
MAKIESEDSLLQDILKDKLYYKSPSTNALINGQKKTAKSF